MLRLSLTHHCARPLAHHPPVMVHELCRAITRSPRWFAMKKAATREIESYVEQQEQRLERKLKRECDKFVQQLSGSKKSKSRAWVKKKEAELAREHERELAELTGSYIPAARFNVLDASLGGGTHTEAILEDGAPFSRVAAIDCDGGGVQRRAEIIEKKYGKPRFKFFPSFRFSQIQTLFGVRAFDTVVLDPGPNFAQLDDPTRGFSLETPDDVSLLDMRYSVRFRSSALDVLNRATEPELFNLAAELALFPNSLARRAVQAIVRRRPFKGLGDVMGALQSNQSMGDFSADSWQHDMAAVHSFGKVAPVMRFLFALRAVVNNEPQELAEGLRAATEALDYDGRLIIFTRLPFEKEIVKEFAENYPFAISCFTERISREEAEEFSQPLVTEMHVLQRTEEPCFELKNAGLLSGGGGDSGAALREMRKDDHMRWLLALDGLGTRYGFPARHFGSGAKPMKHELRFARHNAEPRRISVDRTEKTKMPKK